MYERADWPLPKLQAYFKDDTLALIGQSSPPPPARARPLNSKFSLSQVTDPRVTDRD